MNKIDSFVCERFQIVGSWFQKTFGYDCLHLGWLFFGISIIVETIYYSMVLDKFSYLSLLLHIVFLALFFFKFLVYLFIRSKNLESLREPSETKAANPLRTHELAIAFRTLWFFFLLYEILQGIILIAFAEFPIDNVMSLLEQASRVCFAYFISCTPDPPCSSKIRQWIDEMKAFGKTVPATNAP